MNSHLPPQEHGFIPHGPLYFTHDSTGQPAPPGFAFNIEGQLVKLPYGPWSEGPQAPWESPDNPDYVEYALGRTSIEQQPSADPRVPARYNRDRSESVGHVAPITHEHVALVPQREYLERDGDIVPKRDMGTGSNAVFDNPASIARTQYILSKPIIGYVEVESPVPGQASPLTVVPSGSAEGPATPPFGGAVSLANFAFGHLGSQVANITADVLPGSLVRLTTASSFMNIKGRLGPRYFQSSDSGVLPNIVRTYLLYPGGPPLTNDNFTDLPDNIMTLQGSGAGTIVAAGVQTIPVQYFGWCGLGYVESPLLESVPTRVFRGTVPSAAPSPGVPFTNNALCPIPKGAVSVRLVGGFFNPADTPQAVTVQFTQILDWGAVEGPFAPNGPPIPILEGAVAIGVQASQTAVSGAVEVPFALYYYFDV